jgi:8-oxo-dGTP pyrophosphatase MutT (NUDIX family)
MRNTLSTDSTSKALAAAADFPEQLAAALNAGHRGSLRRNRMSPQLSYGRHAGRPPCTARAAAVMLLLFQRDGRWHLPLTERPATLVHHGGQICLPGGAVDEGESSSDAATREMREELGISEEVTLLGRLADCYVFASDYLITPWVAVTQALPEWRPHLGEVQRVVEMPFDVLLDDDSIGSLTIQRGPLEFHAPCFHVGDARIWGATSTILDEFAEVLEEALGVRR